MDRRRGRRWRMRGKKKKLKVCSNLEKIKKKEEKKGERRRDNQTKGPSGQGYEADDESGWKSKG